MPPVRKYPCTGCGQIFERFYAVSTDRSRYKFVPNSLQWHFVMSPECNDKQAEEIIANRRRREEREHREMLDWA